jgi:hypothetical protein
MLLGPREPNPPFVASLGLVLFRCPSKVCLVEYGAATCEFLRIGALSQCYSRALQQATGGSRQQAAGGSTSRYALVQHMLYLLAGSPGCHCPPNLPKIPRPPAPGNILFGMMERGSIQLSRSASQLPVRKTPRRSPVFQPPQRQDPQITVPPSERRGRPGARHSAS